MNSSAEHEATGRYMLARLATVGEKEPSSETASATFGA